MVFQTEYEFTLPCGYVDSEGTLHKSGIMRLATAADEIMPMRDSRVQQNPSYFTVIVLSRVITQLGTLKDVDCTVIEALFARDMAYLNDMYQRLNALDGPVTGITCPHCGQTVDVPNFMQED